MQYSELIDRVREVLQDTIGVTFTGEQEQRAATKGTRKVANKVGRTEARQSLDLVASQQAYLVPTGIRRLKKVQIIPENGNEPPEQGIPQVPLSCIPVTVPAERDPDRFALNMNAGAADDQYQLFFWPAPARSATDAIVITYDFDVVFDGTSTQPVPFPPQFEDAIIYYVASFLLLERSDENDTQEAQKFMAMADQEVRENRPIDALSHYADYNRSMP